jgi:hypothetical protein
MLNRRPAGEFHGITSVEVRVIVRERLGPRRSSKRVILRNGETGALMRRDVRRA